MAIGDRRDTYSSVGFVAVLIIIGLVLIYAFVPRSGEPIKANPTKAPISTNTPAPATPK